VNTITATRRQWIKGVASAGIASILSSTLPSSALDPGKAFAKDEPWKKIFDGKTLDGWTKRGSDATYRVEGDAIVGTTVQGSTNTFLCTDETYGNFILELEFKVHPKMNSGVQIRSQSLADYRDFTVHGYQVEIDPSKRAWTGGIYDEGRRGWLYDLDEKPEAQKAFKQNEWNHFRIEAKDDSIKTWINDVPAADLKDSMTARGFIALQVHGTRSRKPHEVRWRNIRIINLEQKDPEAQTETKGNHE
jgi:hypothetical protein